MILEFNLDYRSSSLVYEKIFTQTLDEFNLSGKILREHFTLKLYVESESTETLEEFSTAFASALPHSIFLYESSAQILEEMPKEESSCVETEKFKLPFCPKCMKKVIDQEDENFYNIFTECEVCGYGIQGENRSYKQEIALVANEIKEGKKVEINTFYGKYYIGVPDKTCNTLSFDIIAYDLATIEKYANVETHEIMALGSFEKPLVKLKNKIKFAMDYEVETELVRYKLADDFILYLLMQELHKIGVDVIFITDEKIETESKLLLVDFKEKLEPIEIVASEKSVAIISGEKGLMQFPIQDKNVVACIGSFNSVIKEHQLENENIAGINLSKKYENNILIYGKKYGLIKYLSFDFTFNSIEEIFQHIVATNETGEKIVQNYKRKFPELYEKISKIVFKEKEFNIYRLWGVVSIILNFSKSDDPLIAAEVLENSALSFMGTKGPRIDYKLLKIENKAYLDPYMCIRTAMSFKLAGVDQGTLSYGVIESFLEFLSNELDEIKQNMSITSVVVTGSLLGNRHLFSKMSKEISVNHKIYFNNQMPVDGINMFYGGMEIDAE